MDELMSQVENRLRAALPVTSLALQDDSHLHAGHAGARSGRHFSLQITSPVFEGKTRVACHRLVYDAVADLMASRIHALAIDARPTLRDQAE